ncbi:MAG: 2-phospho-L-lactate guanylyltransferase, partial [Thermomicrobiales bacterium]
SRLASVLNADERAVLIGVMAKQVIAAVAEAGIADSIIVVSRAADLLPRLGTSGIRTELVHQPLHSVGLNAAIDLGRRDALRRKADRILVLSADLPLLTATSIGCLAGDNLLAEVTLVTDRAGVGTNALMLRGEGAIERFPFHFGWDSRRLHREAAADLATSYSERCVQEIALDLDTPDDWAMLSREMRQHLLMSQTSPHLPSFGAIGNDPVTVLERA